MKSNEYSAIDTDKLLKKQNLDRAKGYSLSDANLEQIKQMIKLRQEVANRGGDSDIAADYVDTCNKNIIAYLGISLAIS